jgi:hypothetical protein
LKADDRIRSVLFMVSHMDGSFLSETIVPRLSTPSTANLATPDTLTSMMPSKWDHANRAVGGRLAWQIRLRRERGDSYQSIAFWLRAKGVEVTDETIRQWSIKVLSDS